MPATQPAKPSKTDIIARHLLAAACAGADVLATLTADETLWRERKADGSFVTAADLAADKAIKACLLERLPHVPVVSEESPDAAQARHEFILVDPLDGTAEFMRGGHEFAVAVAYIIDGRAVAGAITAPRLGRAWWAGTRAQAGIYTPGGGLPEGGKALQTRQGKANEMVALVSRLHGDDWSARAVSKIGPAGCRAVSSALKFGLIASGEAQFHIRCGPTMEWDVAAGDAIIKASGGLVTDLKGAPLVYGQASKGFRNPPFVAAAGSRILEAALDAVQRES